jgi:hypothetical protein
MVGVDTGSMYAEVAMSAAQPPMRTSMTTAFNNPRRQSTNTIVLLIYPDQRETRRKYKEID